MSDLKVIVSERRLISSSKEEHWFPSRLFRLKDNSIVLGFSVGADVHANNLATGMPHALLKSFDDGWNWFLLGVSRQAVGETLPDTVFEDGTVYGTFHPLAKPDGDIYCLGYRSKDSLKSWEGPEEISIHFPEGTLEIDYSQQRSILIGPRCYLEGNIARISDGSLLRIADGVFKGDKYYRVCVLRSVDEGKSWIYLSTIADAKDEPADFSESALIGLPDGDLICIMRTDHHQGFKNGSNPMFQSKSSDGGKTWSKPVYTGVWGVLPKLLLLQNGILACSYGRVSGSPSLGDRIMFSQDNGETWTNHTEIYNGPSSGYTSILEVRPNEIMYVYDSLYYGWGGKNSIEMVNIKVERT